jgi:hypothetical protein
VWTLRVRNPGTPGGKVRVNALEVSPGETPWTGMYFNGVPVKVRAVARPGFQFKGWLPASLPQEPEISLDPVSRESFIVHPGSPWKYSDHGRDLGKRWRESLYPPAWFWREGRAPLGYGDEGLATPVSFGKEERDKNPTTYFRHTFLLERVEENAVPAGGLVVDDGAAVYLNGHEVHRVNLPEGEIAHGTWATATVGGEEERAWRRFAIPKNLLVKGWNVIAVEVHQGSNMSSDIRFDFALRYEAPPVEIQPVFEKIRVD